MGNRLTTVRAIAGHVFGQPRKEVDDVDKSASFHGDATPRRSTSSLDET
jgi:hypothetical protein